MTNRGNLRIEPGAERLALPSPDGHAESENDAPRLFREQLRVLYKHRRLAAACFAGTVALSVIVTLATPRRYTATTRLEVARRSPIQLHLDGIVHRSDEGDGSTAATAMFLSTQIATLQSRDLAVAVIAGRRLAENPAFVAPAVGNGTALAAAGSTISSRADGTRWWRRHRPSPEAPGPSTRTSWNATGVRCRCGRCAAPT